MQDQDPYLDIEPLYIDEELKAFLDREVGYEGTARERLVTLQTLLFGADHLNLQYNDDRTRTAMEVFESRMGNCLSVMNLYVAAARYLNIDANYRVVEVQPTWDRKGTLVVVSEHINATGKLNPFETYIVDFTPEIAVQQMTARTIEDRQARAMYFSNLGVEQLLRGRYQEALGYLRHALWLEPQMADAWNNAGTAFNRMGNTEAAEYSYQMSIYHAPDSAAAMGNLARLYEASGEAGKAAGLRRAVAQLDRRNPYYYFEMGNLSFQDGRTALAISYYEKAIELEETEPVFYLALANVYDYQGDRLKKRQMLNAAAQALSDTSYVYVPGEQKLRILDTSTRLRSTGPMTTISLE
ncbi:MAG: hypothetical protein R3F41_11325 [Gammaproteobacteria bacterium]|nr:tetratricopeptide repeat protein [Pseudomonadales bacterium]MCP5348201.1 tetratricopeptide repeat protein [Pseudomonadales bacterium]